MLQVWHHKMSQIPKTLFSRHQTHTLCLCVCPQCHVPTSHINPLELLFGKHFFLPKFVKHIFSQTKNPFDREDGELYQTFVNSILIHKNEIEEEVGGDIK